MVRRKKKVLGRNRTIVSSKNRIRQIVKNRMMGEMEKEEKNL